MIELLFALCFVIPDGYDCSYSVVITTYEEVNAHWDRPGYIKAMFSPASHTIYLSDISSFHHEWRHAFCYHYYILHDKNHSYCMDPHFKRMQKYD